MQTTDLSTSSASSTEDLIASGLGGNYNKQTVAVTSDGSQHIYEDIDLQAPPKLAPSGVYTTGNAVIKKPIAFKPVPASTVLQQRFHTPVTGGSSPFSSTESSDAVSSTGNLPKCNTKLSSSQSQYSLSQHSYFLEDDNWYSEISGLKLAETPCLVSVVGSGGHESAPYDLAAQTPSPSDSGIAELEAMLREKDSEISYLRETLEQNEQVIFKVYEEKEQAWQREFKKLRSLYESKLRTTQQKLAKTEQLLQLHNQQTQVDKRKLMTELDDSKQHNDLTKCQLAQLESELSSLRSRLEETEWTLCQKSGEIALLKSQLKDSQGDHNTRANELVALKSQLKEARLEAEEKTRDVLKLEHRLRSFGNGNDNSISSESLFQMENDDDEPHETLMRNRLVERDKQDKQLDQVVQENKRLQEMVNSLQEQLETIKEAIEEERVQWLDEKEKVIRFQKQLQANYIYIYRRNKELENLIQQKMPEEVDTPSEDEHSETRC